MVLGQVYVGLQLKKKIIHRRNFLSLVKLPKLTTDERKNRVYPCVGGVPVRKVHIANPTDEGQNFFANIMRRRSND